MTQAGTRFQPHKLNVQDFSQQNGNLAGVEQLQKLQRLAVDLQQIKPSSVVRWQAQGLCRLGVDGVAVPWLHLQARAKLPLLCQRCLHVVNLPVRIDQWFRFVATEEEAALEDEWASEDVLALTPQLDLLELLEDELLLVAPLVPMHETCELAPGYETKNVEVVVEKPHPFAVLAQLKKSNFSAKKRY